MAKPQATALIEPAGPRAHGSRPYSINVTIKLASDAQDEHSSAAAAARKSLERFEPAPGAPDRRSFADVTAASRGGKPGSAAVTVVAVEGSLMWPERPDDGAVEWLRASLHDAGYRVVVHETRECDQPACSRGAVVDWSAAAAVPATWFSNRICGRHDFRSCASCQTLYTLTSVNTDGHGPSVHCAVCGLVMVEWVGSKIWSAELVSRGDLPAPPA